MPANRSDCLKKVKATNRTAKEQSGGRDKGGKGWRKRARNMKEREERRIITRNKILPPPPAD